MKLDWYKTSAYLRCPRLGWLLEKGYRAEGSGRSEALQAGLIMHRVLERMIKSENLTPESATAAVEIERAAITALSAKYSFEAFAKLPTGAAEKLTAWFPGASFAPEQTLAFPLALTSDIEWAARVDVVATLPNGDVHFVELKTSLYSLSLSDVDAYMYSHGQISGQLWLGDRLYTGRFRGVTVMGASFTGRQIEPVVVNWTVERDLAHSYLVYDVAAGLRNSLDQDDEEFCGLNYNPLSCVMFKNLCPMHAVCWRKQPLAEIERDTWTAGKGWLSEEKDSNDSI